MSEVVTVVYVENPGGWLSYANESQGVGCTNRIKD
jgi:hypothetical protein